MFRGSRFKALTVYMMSIHTLENLAISLHSDFLTWCYRRSQHEMLHLSKTIFAIDLSAFLLWIDLQRNYFLMMLAIPSLGQIDLYKDFLPREVINFLNSWCSEQQIDQLPSIVQLTADFHFLL